MASRDLAEIEAATPCLDLPAERVHGALTVAEQADGIGFMPAGRRLPLDAFIFSSPSRGRSLCLSVALLEYPSGVLISGFGVLG